MIMSEVYTRMVDNFVDSAIATTNLVNNMFLTNMETIQLMMDTTRDYFKLGTDTVKSFDKSEHWQLTDTTLANTRF